MKSETENMDTDKERKTIVIADKAFGILFASIAIVSLAGALVYGRWYELFTASMCAAVAVAFFEDIKENE